MFVSDSKLSVAMAPLPPADSNKIASTNKDNSQQKAESKKVESGLVAMYAGSDYANMAPHIIDPIAHVTLSVFGGLDTNPRSHLQTKLEQSGEAMKTKNRGTSNSGLAGSLGIPFIGTVYFANRLSSVPVEGGSRDEFLYGFSARIRKSITFDYSKKYDAISYDHHVHTPNLLPHAEWAIVKETMTSHSDNYSIELRFKELVAVGGAYITRPGKDKLIGTARLFAQTKWAGKLIPTPVGIGIAVSEDEFGVNANLIYLNAAYSRKFQEQKSDRFTFEMRLGWGMKGKALSPV